jgi:hypothetical protein
MFCVLPGASAFKTSFMPQKQAPRKKVSQMPIVNAFAAGIDVGSKSHYVAIGQEKNQTRKFGCYNLNPILVNGKFTKNVSSGKKTDVLDCQWIQKNAFIGITRGKFHSGFIYGKA